MNENAGMISVVIVSFNGMEFIDDCLRSTYDSLAGHECEIIVIDNGSSDGTPDLIKANYPQARLICNETNLGFALAVNQGLDESRGEFIFILNQDTRIVDDATPKLAERMIREESIGTIGPKFIGFEGRLQSTARSFPRYRDLFFGYTGLSRLFPKSTIFSNWKMGWFDHETERPVDQPMGAALMIRREVLKKVGKFDAGFGMFFNDVDFCRRVKDAGYVNLYYPEAVVRHYVGGSTRRDKPRMIIESHRSMYRYFKKYNRNLLSLPCLYFWGLVLFISAYIRVGLQILSRKVT
jgi:GT2 family glycosyltransferase